MARKNKELEPLSYEKQPGETTKQFEAFKLYRDFGLSRNLRKVCDELDKSLALIGRWSSANNWVERALDYDRDMDKQEVLENIKNRREMVKRHGQTSKLFQQKVLERIRSLNPAELSPNDLSRWFETAVKIERLSMGESTEIQNNQLQHSGVNGEAIKTESTQVVDLSNLSDEELENLERIISKSANREADTNGESEA